MLALLDGRYMPIAMTDIVYSTPTWKVVSTKEVELVEPPRVLGTPLDTKYISYLVTGPPEVGAVQLTLTLVGTDCTTVTLFGALGASV